MRPALPALRYWFGLSWAEIVEMPSDELEQYRRDLKKLNRNMQQQAADSRSARSGRFGRTR